MFIHIMLSKLLQTSVVLIALSLSTLPIGSKKSLANEYRTVKFVNNNTQQIVAGYIKLPKARNWSYAFDITEWFERGTSKTINVNANQCIYDVKIVYISGSFHYGRLNFCKSSTVNLTGNGGNYSPSGVYIGTKGCQYTPTWGLNGSYPTGC